MLIHQNIFNWNIFDAMNRFYIARSSFQIYHAIVEILFVNRIAIEICHFENTTLFKLLSLWNGMDVTGNIFFVSLCISLYHFVKYNVNRFDNYKCIEAQSKLDGFWNTESCCEHLMKVISRYLISIFQIQNFANIFYVTFIFRNIFHLNLNVTESCQAH